MVDKRKNAVKSKGKALVPTGQKTLFEMFPPRKAPQPLIGSLPTKLSDESSAGVLPSTPSNENASTLQPAPVATERTLDNEIVDSYSTLSDVLSSSPNAFKDSKPSSALDLLKDDDEAVEFPSSSSPISLSSLPRGISPQLKLEIEPPRPEIIEIPSSSSPIEAPVSPSACTLGAAIQQKIQDGLIPPGGSQHKPIVIDSSPIKPANKPSATAKAVHPFFASKVSKSPPASKISLSKGPTQEIPYPDRYSQHVKGPQSLHESFIHANIPRRQLSGTPDTQPEELNDYTFLNSPTTLHALTLEPSFLSIDIGTEREGCLRSIPDEHAANHPAIDRLMHFARSGKMPPTSRHPWAEKWRPRFAQEVLGNEACALYLRDWLRALELQLESTDHQPAQASSGRTGIRGTATTGTKSLKRPRVVREVDKRQRKKARADSEDDRWIVNTDESGDEDIRYDTEEDMDHAFPRDQSPPEDATTNVLLPPQTFEQLHNTILLAGPHGTGKTACVYACAEELGWEVFEVYPGIGKRNGANIDNLIGEVGKNHLVHQTSRSRNELFVPLSPIKSSRIRKKGEHLVKRTEGSQTLSTHLESILCQVGEKQAGDGTSFIRQSLILLEEVDILFKEDTNFWPTLTRVIRDCKRPVVCTCNDISLVPLPELPLQKVLVFKPCPPPIAVSYLQGLSCAEGYIISRDVLLRMYGSVHRPAVMDIPNATDMGVTDLPTYDLRRTIHTLQIAATSRILPPEVKPGVGNQEEPSTEPSEPGEMLSACRTAANHANLISFLDSYVSRDSAKVPIALDIASSVPSADDELGHSILYESTPCLRGDGDFGLNVREEEMISTARGLAGSAFACVKNKTYQERELLYARMEYQEQIGKVLKELCPEGTYANVRRCLYTEYGPWIRAMVAGEDEQESNFESRQRSKRLTRNSGGHYDRCVVVSEDAREGLSRSSFSV